MADTVDPTDPKAEAGEDIALAAYVDRIAEKLLSTVDPEAPADGELRRLLADALAAAARMEQALDAERSRCDWLMTQVTRDETTGLLNRRGFSDALYQCLARGRRYNETGALMLVDLTGLTEVNRKFGPAAGDFALSALANILRSRFREVDYLARLEGGRFASLLLMISPEDARRRAAMLKSYLGRLTVPWDGQDLALSVQIGLVNYGQRDAAEDLLERAEAELEERTQRLSRLTHPVP